MDVDGSEQQRDDLEVRGLRLIDVSSEDDCLIGSPSGNHMVQDYFDLSVVGDALEREGAVDLSKEREEDAMPSESLEQKRTRKPGKCNLRKSLAWDSAFFTSAGVLDPEELSIIHGGLKKADTNPLPGILEDVRRSAESSSTLDSDSFTLESLEVGLFDDIRASIQKSTSKAANVACHSGKAGPRESGVQSSRKTGIAPHNRMKPVAVSKRQSVNTQIPEKTKKESITHSQAIQAAAKTGETNSLSRKPPKIIAKANSSSAALTKRTSLSANRVSVGNSSAKAFSGKGQHVGLEKPATSNASITSTSSPKSSDSSSSATKMKSLTSLVRHTRSGSSSSDSTGKSPLKSLKNKTDLRDAIRPSGSTLKASVKIPSKNKSDFRNSRLSAYLTSMSNTKSISPASSIDGWSTESSSSTSTINQRSNSSKTNADIISSGKGFSSERDAHQTLHLQTYPHDQPSVGHENKGKTVPSECAKKQSLTSAAISHTASKDVSRSFKPSGLRMPSPKIGFFDAEKSVARSPSSGLQSNLGERSRSPKNVAASGNLTGGALKGKSTKHQSSRTLTAIGSNNLDARKVGVRFSPLSMRHTSAQPQELSNASPKLSSTSSAGKDRHGKTMKVRNDASINSEHESHLKNQEVEDTNKDNGTLNSALNVGDGCKDVLNDNMRMKTTELQMPNEITHTEEHGAHLSRKAGSGSCNYDNIYLSDKSSENTRYIQDQVESKFHLRLNSNEKENSLCFEGQVDGLSRHVGVIDLNMDELSTKKSSSLSYFNENDKNNADSGDPKLVLSNFTELLVHGQDDYTKTLLKSSPLSPGSLNAVHSTRTPLAVKPSFCNAIVSLESAPESTTEKVSASPFLEAALIDKS